jgi:protein ImuB
MQLETLVLPGAVAEIHIAAEATAPCGRRQGELFAGAARDAPAQLSLLIERLSNRLGGAQVVRPELQPEAEVERAYRVVPLAGGEAAATPPRPVSAAPRLPPPNLSPNLSPDPCAVSTAPGLPPLCRPLWIFQPPAPIEVVGLAGDGPPALFHYGQPHRVVRCFGPERIETGWWRGASSRRDYYRVETESGQRLWLFRRLQDQRWFLHGEFG